jgi:very-short-patch-repair endonuclease
MKTRQPKKKQSFDRRIAAIAAKQYDVVDRADVFRAKGTDRHIFVRLRNKRWQQVHPGVYLIGAEEATWQQRAFAAIRACDDGAFVTAETGLALYGVDGAERAGDIVVTVTQTDRPSPDGVRVLRSRRPLPGARVVDGIPRASLERCLLDFAATADEATVEEAVESALDEHLTAERRIWECITKEGGKGVPGSARLRKVMLERPDGLPAKSVLEIEVGHLLRGADLRNFVRNYPVLDGKYKIDDAFVAEKVAIEADSRRWHRTKSQRERDRRRQAELEAAGWHFERVTFGDVHLDPVGTIKRIRAALEARGADPGIILRRSTSA